MGTLQEDVRAFMLLDLIESVLSVTCDMKPKKQRTSENQQETVFPLTCDMRPKKQLTIKN